MFTELLQSIVEKVEGAQAAVVMGMDGISVEKYMPDNGTVSIESLAAEYTSLLRTCSSSNQDLGQGILDEVVVGTETRTIVIRMITSEYFLLILLDKNGNLGRARFELKKAKYLLAKDFAI